MDFLVAHTLLVSMVKNKSWQSNLILAVIIQKYQKQGEISSEIIRSKDTSYGHIQHEKKLPYGSFFSYWMWQQNVFLDG